MHTIEVNSDLSIEIRGNPPKVYLVGNIGRRIGGESEVRILDAEEVDALHDALEQTRLFLFCSTTGG
jgi:hypothetical protein